MGKENGMDAGDFKMPEKAINKQKDADTNKFENHTERTLENLRKIDDLVLRAYALQGAMNSSSFLLKNNPEVLAVSLYSQEEFNAETDVEEKGSWLDWRKQTLEKFVESRIEEEIENIIEINSKKLEEGKELFYNSNEYPRWFRDAYDRLWERFQHWESVKNRKE